MSAELEILRNRAVLLARNKNWGKDAAHINNKIIDLDPECAAAYTRLGKIYTNNGDHFAAMHMYEMVLEFEPNNTIAKNGYTRSKKIFGDTSVSEALKQICSFDQVFSVACKFKYNNDLPSAIAAYRRALDLATDSSDIQMTRNGLAAAYSHSGVNAEAEKIYRENLKEHPGDNVAKVGLAGVLSSIEAYQEAERLCKDVLAKEPNNSYSRNCLGGIYGKQGRSALADRYFN